MLIQRIKFFLHRIKCNNLMLSMDFAVLCRFHSISCGPQGFEQLSSTLAQMPLSTEKLATQVWRCCHDFELMDLGNFVLPLLLYCLPMLYSYKFFIPAAQICIKMATELECVGLHVSALSWLIRGGHNLRITRCDMYQLRLCTACIAQWVE